ncbi:hypothetical protein [Streptomyces sp. Root369]|uniref:hypothetical protein n=1 Tax=Streptomyces sp. Root369 TaxID=1736523 RepID=UPI000AB2B66C|nr:hypothetical protein [Streptomyces sp. Root369]
MMAAGLAVVLAFVTVFFGWIPNPFEDESSTASPSPAAHPPGAGQVKKPGLEVLSQTLAEPARLPAKFHDEEGSRDGTVLATRLLLTLRNRGDLEAVVTEFRFTVVAARALTRGTEPNCLPVTGGGPTEITAEYDAVLPNPDVQLPKTIVLKDSYSLEAGKAERVILSLGLKDEPYDPVLYVVRVELREGRQKTLIAAGSVAFLAPVEATSDFLLWAGAAVDRKSALCDPDLPDRIDRAMSQADDASPQLRQLTNVLSRPSR